MITTAFWYLTTEQWRYDRTQADRIASPVHPGSMVGKSNADFMVESMKRGWMPSYPHL